MRPTPTARRSRVAISVMNGLMLTVLLPFAARGAALSGALDMAYRAESDGRLDDAISGYTEALKANPTDVEALNRRGLVYREMRRFDEAMADFNEALRINPDYADAYLNRGNLKRRRNELAGALVDYEAALRIAPNFSDAFINRAVAYRRLGSYSEALSDYEKALEIDANLADALDGIAWISAICPDPEFRDGQRAVRSALRACELSDWKEPGYVATLAAAYAESGNFAEAERWQNRYLEFPLSNFQRSAGRNRLGLYMHNQPYRALRPSGSGRR